MHIDGGKCSVTPSLSITAGEGVGLQNRSVLGTALRRNQRLHPFATGTREKKVGRFFRNWALGLLGQAEICRLTPGPKPFVFIDPLDPPGGTPGYIRSAEFTDQSRYFSVTASFSLKVSAVSAGRTICLLPVRVPPASPAPPPARSPMAAPLPPPARPPMMPPRAAP